nr:glycoside hydrolase family 9 protein [uncultured Bacteroides sp.]
MRKRFCQIGLCCFFILSSVHAQDFKLTSSGYFRNGGIDVMSFSDFYPEGHQGGVCIIMNGNRVATNGDIRLEATPGQWQPVPKQLNREVNESANTITTNLCYPDSSRHLTGFNPMIYPDLQFNYTVNVKGVGNVIVVTVDLDRPIPKKFLGKVGFNLELFPGDLFGKPWIMDAKSGIFPQQANGPTISSPANQLNPGNYSSFTLGSGKLADISHLAENKQYNPIIADDIIAEPYAIGRTFTVCPNDPYNKYTVKSEMGELKLYDGRMNHNNGWFVLRSEIAAGATKEAVKWVITPNVVKEWIRKPVVQVSQVGYHPTQSKEAIIELDAQDKALLEAKLYQITSNGEKVMLSAKPLAWGNFLRYHYLKFNFSSIKEEGLYQVKYGNSESCVFRIAKDVYDRGIWQPVLEYFLPIQMCHMRVNEKYRVWHDYCHLDDARMAPALNHIDGYSQGASTLTKYKSGEFVPGLNTGGWHDAGDYDLRVESQSNEAYVLAVAYEAFHLNYDVTSVNQHERITEIHQPDGKPDILQQVENGVLTVVGGYHALGRLYRGIICNHLRQYVMLGDAGAMTDNVTGNEDDRWVFTEDNPARELETAAGMAASARVLKGFNDTLSTQALQVARELFEKTKVDRRSQSGKLQAAVELFLTTGETQYKDYILSQQEYIVSNIGRLGWFVGRADVLMKNASFSKAIRPALLTFCDSLQKQGTETPYGIPYRPSIWGAGWDIQSVGFRQYFLVKSYPDIFNKEIIYNALNFVLGCHPGSNTESFASGVGSNSATVAYGVNRADWSYIPGGVISGTAMIRPDLPELLKFPYLWQQAEYCLGGSSSQYMFLVLAAQEFLNK